MMRRDSQKLTGVLNDWDLAKDGRDRSSKPSEMERTGTVAFMALDIFSPRRCHGVALVQHLHRYELEAEIWALPCLFINYKEDGKREFDGRAVVLLNMWRINDPDTCYDMKASFLLKMIY
jgi:hypothetical protein